MQEPTARPVGPYASGPPEAALTVDAVTLDRFRGAELWRAVVIGVVVVAYVLFSVASWPFRRRGRTSRTRRRKDWSTGSRCWDLPS